jgi:hypothetical protein
LRRSHVINRPETAHPSALPAHNDLARTTPHTTIKIVANPRQKELSIISPRWPVERTLAWLTGYRRVERHPTTR